MREQVGDHAVLAGVLGQARLLPVAPRLGQVRRRAPGRGRSSAPRRAALGVDEAAPCSSSAAADALGALGQLRSRDANADPDLAAGIVQAVAVAPHDGHGESHGASLSAEQVRAVRRGCAPRSRPGRARALSSDEVHAVELRLRHSAPTLRLAEQVIETRPAGRLPLEDALTERAGARLQADEQMVVRADRAREARRAARSTRPPRPRRAAHGRRRRCASQARRSSAMRSSSSGNG